MGIVKSLLISTACVLTFSLGLDLGFVPIAWAQRVFEVKINGQDFEPKEMQVWPGDTVRICSDSNYRRQPYSSNKYNKFGKRKADGREMIKNGECKEFQVYNPTGKMLTITVRDAVAGKAKLKLKIWQESKSK